MTLSCSSIHDSSTGYMPICDLSQSVSSSLSGSSGYGTLHLARRTSSSKSLESDVRFVSNRIVVQEKQTLREWILEDCDAETPKGNLQTGIASLKKASLQGESGAAIRLGHIYRHMSDVNMSSIYALFWFQYAMKLDPSLRHECMRHCSSIRREIISTYCNGIDSLKSLLKLAKQHNPVAQYLLGFSYEKGSFSDIALHSGKAFYWYEKCAKQMKNADLYFDLGVRYVKGDGCKRSIRKAISCFKKAEILKHDGARVELGLIYYQKKSFTRAISYLRTELKRSDPRLFFTLGEMYSYGFGFERSFKKAIVFYKKATLFDYAKAQAALGCIYAGEFGDDAKDLTQAIYWFKKAARQFNELAQYRLAIFYYNGQGVKKNKSKAFQLLNDLSTQCQNDDTKSIYFEMRANVEYMLGRMYFEGRGTEKNEDLGVQWLEKAISHGHPLAKKYVNKMF